MEDNIYKCINCGSDLCGLYQICPGCNSSNIRKIVDKTNVFEMNKLIIDETHHYINYINKKASRKYDRIDEVVVCIGDDEKIFTLKQIKKLLGF